MSKLGDGGSGAVRLGNVRRNAVSDAVAGVCTPVLASGAPDKTGHGTPLLSSPADPFGAAGAE